MQLAIAGSFRDFRCRIVLCKNIFIALGGNSWHECCHFLLLVLIEQLLPLSNIAIGYALKEVGNCDKAELKQIFKRLHRCDLAPIRRCTHIKPYRHRAIFKLRKIKLLLHHADISVCKLRYLIAYGIIGMSGAGKSTLVRCINLLEKPTAGEVVVDGQRLDTMTPAQLRAARREITMIFQRFNLLMQRTCLQNVCFPMELSGVKKADGVRRAKELLELVGLPDKAQAYPAQLSGGQQQRVAIARALATQPKVLLCDEATSALDPNTTHQILELIRDINQKLGITVVVITHQMSVVKTICNHVAILDGGVVAEKGLVSEVFAAPKSAAGRRLVFPGGADALVSDPQAVRRVRLTFRDSVTTGTPLVARLASEEGILCTVISASTQKLSEEVYGSMLLGIPSGQFQRAMDYIGTMSNIRVEEVDGHVQ